MKLRTWIVLGFIIVIGLGAILTAQQGGSPSSPSVPSGPVDGLIITGCDQNGEGLPEASLVVTNPGVDTDYLVTVSFNGDQAYGHTNSVLSGETRRFLVTDKNIGSSTIQPPITCKLLDASRSLT